MSAPITDETQLDELVLAKLRRWNPGLTSSDLDRSLFELNLDSLNTLEVVHLLERNCLVTADLDDIEEMDSFREIIDHFRGLASR
jgi:acyl carrier protein